MHDILWHFHHSLTTGHEEVNKTLQHVMSQFWWKGFKANVKKFIKEYAVCQREKYEATRPPGHLMPLPIPTRPWTDISMDFVEALFRFERRESILVVIDHIIKYAHFLLLYTKYDAQVIADVFQKNNG